MCYFFRFPHSNPELIKQWIANMHRAGFTCSRKSVLCSDHFEESCFDRTGQTIRLRSGSIPTIFNLPGSIPTIYKLPEHLTKVHISVQHSTIFQHNIAVVDLYLNLFNHVMKYFVEDHLLKLLVGAFLGLPLFLLI